MTCTECENRGYLLATHSERGTEVERCDACQRFPHDQAASVSVYHDMEAEREKVRLLRDALHRSLPQLRGWVALADAANLGSPERRKCAKPIMEQCRQALAGTDPENPKDQ